jgi:mRNA-degrading endonuclease RelE of RelBE toxin-antitoxin system
MEFLNEEILKRLKALPEKTREKVKEGLIKMLAERPNGFVKSDLRVRLNSDNEGAE